MLILKFNKLNISVVIIISVVKYAYIHDTKTVILTTQNTLIKFFTLIKNAYGAN